MSRHRGIVLAGALLVAVAAYAVLGWPDLGRSVDLLFGRFTGSNALAFVGALCWLGLAVVAVNVLGVGRVFRRPRSSDWRVSLTVLLAGSVILALGITQRSAGYSVCCASPSTAHRVQALVH